MRDGGRAGIVRGMTFLLRRGARTPALALVSALAALTAAAPARAALPYSADVTVSAQERWTSKPDGYPRDCPGWTYAKGTVSAAATARGPLTFAGSGGVFAGGLSMDATQALDVKRVIDWKIHQAGTAPPCIPCGPQSELGACAPPPGPDQKDASTCAPPATSIDGLVRATLAVNGTLVVEAASAPARKILLECTFTQLLPPGVPLGTPEPQLKTIRFPGAGARIRALRPGGATTFRKVSKAGSACPATKKAVLTACTTYTTIIKVTRRKD